MQVNKKRWKPFVAKNNLYNYYRVMLGNKVELSSILDLFNLYDVTYYQYYLFICIGLLNTDIDDIDVLCGINGIDLNDLRNKFKPKYLLEFEAELGGFETVGLKSKGNVSSFADLKQLLSD